MIYVLTVHDGSSRNSLDIVLGVYSTHMKAIAAARKTSKPDRLRWSDDGLSAFSKGDYVYAVTPVEVDR